MLPANNSHPSFKPKVVNTIQGMCILKAFVIGFDFEAYNCLEAGTCFIKAISFFHLFKSILEQLKYVKEKCTQTLSSVTLFYLLCSKCIMAGNWACSPSTARVRNLRSYRIETQYRKLVFKNGVSQFEDNNIFSKKYYKMKFLYILFSYFWFLK